MKKHIISTFLLLSMFALIMLSCKTTPKAEPVQEKVSTGEIQDAASKTEAARKRAMDVDSPQYFPSDWEIEEARYGAARISSRTTKEEIDKAIALYNTVASEYDALFDKSVPLYAQAKEDEIMAVRNQITETHFPEAFPEYLENADNLALKAQEQYEAKDYSSAKTSAESALAEYSTLLIGAKTFMARQEVVNRGFQIYDSENFESADAIAETALNEYEAGNKKDAEAHAQEAETRYRLVIANSWTTYAGDKQMTAASERERAVQNKVNVASKDMFRDADVVYEQAQSTLDEKDYEAAANLFTQAEALFVVASRETERKRTRAVETLKIAAERVEESDETALEVEKQIGGKR